MNKIQNLVVMMLLLGLSGCATVSEEDCYIADWRALGERDGALGHRPDRVDRHESACRKYSVSVNRDEYLSGYNSGIASFCIPSNGYRQAKSKYQYNDVCPSHMEAGFLQKYVKGLNDVIEDLEFDRSRAMNLLDRALIQRADASSGSDTDDLDNRVSRARKRLDSAEQELEKIYRWQRRAIERL